MDLSPLSINNAVKCLENRLASSQNEPYTMILITYALALADHPKANSSMKALLNLATEQNVRINKRSIKRVTDVEID